LEVLRPGARAVDDHTGAIDLVINRRETDTLTAATYDCMRFPWRLQDGGPGTAIYKTEKGACAGGQDS
jgi:hypothetical protein